MADEAVIPMTVPPALAPGDATGAAPPMRAVKPPLGPGDAAPGSIAVAMPAVGPPLGPGAATGSAPDWDPVVLRAAGPGSVPRLGQPLRRLQRRTDLTGD